LPRLHDFERGHRKDAEAAKKNKIIEGKIMKVIWTVRELSGPAAENASGRGKRGDPTGRFGTGKWKQGNLFAGKLMAGR
jgi:hypothetical protein